MFRRRKKRKVGERVRELVWPRAGWRRLLTYLGYRLGRMAGSPRAIAAGFACGAAVSMMPFVGIHFVLAAVLAMLVRGNVVAGLMGTIIGNPWTFPFIWESSYALGQWILSEPTPADADVKREAVTAIVSLIGNLLSGDVAHFGRRAWSIWYPMMIGSLPIAAATWIVIYVPMHRFISSFQARRAARRNARAQAARATGRM